MINRGQVSRELYQRLKQTEQSSAKSLDLTAELLRQGLPQEASAAEERARAGINELKRGVEHAAGSVLGDEAQALRRARDELERLAEQVSREIDQGEGNPTNRAPGGAASQEMADNDAQQPQASAGAKAEGDQTRPPPEQQLNRGERPGSENAGERAGTDQPGQNAGQAGNPPGTRRDGDANRAGNPGSSSNRDRTGAAPGGGGQRGRQPFDIARLLESRGGSGGGPITGENFAPWSDGLREVEELVDAPALRSDVARARERAREMRQDFKRGQKKPDWAQVRLQVLKPLIEVREQVAEELARLGPREDLVPIDRDPVPSQYSDLVRRYYEALGKDKGQHVEAPASDPK
jgi:hypothetical protein